LQGFWPDVFSRFPGARLILTCESGSHNEPYYVCRAILRMADNVALVRSSIIDPSVVKTEVHYKTLDSVEVRRVLQQTRRLAGLVKSDYSSSVYDPEVTFLTVTMGDYSNTALYIGAAAYKEQVSNEIFRFVDSLFAF
jgi:hypothetical protein